MFDGWGIKSLQKMWRNWAWTPPPEQRTARTNELNGSGQRVEEERDKGLGKFCSGWSHQPGSKTPYLSRLVAPTGTNRPRGLLFRLEPPIGTNEWPLVLVEDPTETKGPCTPACPTSRWTRELKRSLVPGPTVVGTSDVNQRFVL